MPLDDKDHAKLLYDVYVDATNTIRHYDTQRAAFASLALSALAFLTGFAGTQAKSGGSVELVRMLAITGLCVALLSCAMVSKINSLITRQRVRARTAANLLSERHKLDGINATDEQVRSQSKLSMWHRIPISGLWISIFLLFAILGLVGTFFPAYVIAPSNCK